MNIQNSNSNKIASLFPLFVLGANVYLDAEGKRTEKRTRIEKKSERDGVAFVDVVDVGAK